MQPGMAGKRSRLRRLLCTPISSPIPSAAGFRHLPLDFASAAAGLGESRLVPLFYRLVVTSGACGVHCQSPVVILPGCAPGGRLGFFPQVFRLLKPPLRFF